VVSVAVPAFENPWANAGPITLAPRNQLIEGCCSERSGGHSPWTTARMPLLVSGGAGSGERYCSRKNGRIFAKEPSSGCYFKDVKKARVVQARRRRFFPSCHRRSSSIKNSGQAAL
jgi:hypothetical protein